MANARQCRREAEQCYRLAETASSPEAQALYQGMARTWELVAGQIENLKVLETMAQSGPDRTRFAYGSHRLN